MSISRILEGEPVKLYGDGRNMRNWLFVLDNCRAIDLIIRAGECGIYNVSADNQIANIDLVKKIMTVFGKPNGKIAFVEDRKGHDRKYAVNTDRLTALGWKPEAEFEKELENTLKWYKNNR